jgi:hypothetical protein
MLLGFSCENENFDHTKCAQVKLIQQWCSDPSQLAVIEILSDLNIGEEWTKGLTTYENVVLAQLDSSLIKNGVDWSSVANSAESIFYLEYTTSIRDPLNMCYVCCPPNKVISITSVSSTPCPIKKD